MGNPKACPAYGALYGPEGLFALHFQLCGAAGYVPGERGVYPNPTDEMISETLQLARRYSQAGIIIRYIVHAMYGFWYIG